MDIGRRHIRRELLPTPHSISERLGFWTGVLISPVFGIGSALRKDRVFHPKGVFFEASVVPGADAGEFSGLARRLAGNALIRLSAGGWRRNRRFLPDVLGFTIRFKGQSGDTDAGLQDLLMVTARSPWSLVPDSLMTDRSSFLNNIYYGLSPFEVDGQRDLQLRIIPRSTGAEGGDRYERIVNAVDSGNACFELQISKPNAAADWLILATIHIRQAAKTDTEKVFFHPFRDGQAINPQGFIHYLRAVPYLASRYARKTLNDEH
ncbi:hypothetical protein [Allohahella marinimesophila]|uniref:Uncharacterized protein n=1 Tax=Allohahella marinimesophila TaxID=1054972 RepID=A0ABP7P4I9_9GAMM